MEATTLQNTIMSETQSGGDNNYPKTSQKYPEGLGFNSGATHNLGKHTRIPGRTTSSDFLWFIKTHYHKITDVSALGKNFLSGDVVATHKLCSKETRY